MLYLQLRNTIIFIHIFRFNNIISCQDDGCFMWSSVVNCKTRARNMKIIWPITLRYKCYVREVTEKNFVLKLIKVSSNNMRNSQKIKYFLRYESSTCEFWHLSQVGFYLQILTAVSTVSCRATHSQKHSVAIHILKVNPLVFLTRRVTGQEWLLNTSYRYPTKYYDLYWN